MDRSAGERGRGVDAQRLHDSLTRPNGHMQVAPIEVKLSKLLPHVPNQLRAALSRCRQQIQEKEIYKGSIPLRQVARQADAPALLPSDQHVLREHKLPNILESDRALVTYESKLLRNLRDNLTLGKCAHDRASPAFVAIRMQH